MPPNAQLFDDEWLLASLERALESGSLFMADDEVRELVRRYRALKARQA